jgi:hypothetical protein
MKRPLSTKTSRRQLRWIVAIVMLGAGVGLVHAMSQTEKPVKAAEKKSRTSLVDDEPQWEYLVVSFGKAKFSVPAVEAAEGNSKAIRYFGLSTAIFEASETQKSLDVLGRYGWSIVSVVGSIGGDQQFVLKRKLIANRIEKERQVAEELEKIAAAALRVAKKERAEPKPAPKPGPRNPLDLDAIEAAQLSAKITKALREIALKDFNDVAKSLDLPVQVDSTLSYFGGSPAYSGIRGGIQIEIDVTNTLIDGYQYRKSALGAGVIRGEIKRLERESNGRYKTGYVLDDGWHQVSVDTTFSATIDGEKHSLLLDRTKLFIKKDLTTKLREESTSASP